MLGSLLFWFSRHRWPAWLWTFLILVACTWPGKDLPDGPVTYFDKIVHVGMFAGWTLLWTLLKPRQSGLVAAVGILFGVFIEFYQQMLPFDRSFDWWDIVADAGGVLLGYLLFVLVNKYADLSQQRV